MPNLSGKTRLKVLAVFVLIFFLSRTPLWIGFLILDRYYVAYLVLASFAATLMLTCPFIAARWKPHLAGFDKTWLPSKRFHIIWAVILVVVLLAYSGLSGYLLTRLGFWDGPESLMRKTISPVSPGSILFQAVLLIIIYPIAEEIFWRAYSLEQFTKILPRSLAVFLQAALFSLVHFRPLGLRIVIFGQGLIFGVWRARMRSLLPIILAHIVLNALSLGPLYYRHYTQVSTELSTWNKLADNPYLKEVLDKYEKTKQSAEGKEIRLWATKSMSLGVPKIIQFLEHTDEGIRDYAVAILAAAYGQRASAYFAELLDSDNDVIVYEILRVVGRAECRQLIPKVRAVVMRSSTFRVQVLGLMTLKELGDLEGIQEIVETHPSEEVRKVGVQLLGNKDGQATAVPPA